MKKTWAIGDIHGCFDSMQEILSKIPEQDDIVFLGDYIDRGHQQYKVVNWILDNFENPRFIFLMGNHEQMFLEDNLPKDHLYDPQDVYDMLRPVYCYKWYQVLKSDPQFCFRVLQKFPKLKIKHETEFNYFIHGGIPEPYTFEDIDRDIGLWHRYSPTNYNPYYKKFLTHGHTPVDKPLILSHRANIDTGCVFDFPSSKLTALSFNPNNGQPEEILQV